MVELLLAPSAEAELHRLQQDSTCRQIYSRINDALDLLEDEPLQAAVRRQRYHRIDAWGVPVHGSSHDYLIVWTQLDTDTVLVRYIGPDFH
jgi:ParE toxin of type II toxin-antitoxin system, parDE